MRPHFSSIKRQRASRNVKLCVGLGSRHPDLCGPLSLLHGGFPLLREGFVVGCDGCYVRLIHVRLTAIVGCDGLRAGCFGSRPGPIPVPLDTLGFDQCLILADLGVDRFARGIHLGSVRLHLGRKRPLLAFFGGNLGPVCLDVGGERVDLGRVSPDLLTKNLDLQLLDLGFGLDFQNACLEYLDIGQRRLDLCAIPVHDRPVDVRLGPLCRNLGFVRPHLGQLRIDLGPVNLHLGAVCLNERLIRLHARIVDRDPGFRHVTG